MNYREEKHPPLGKRALFSKKYQTGAESCRPDINARPAAQALSTLRPIASPAQGLTRLPRNDKSGRFSDSRQASIAESLLFHPLTLSSPNLLIKPGPPGMTVIP
jgi:hypothetical protein